jgi:hypothetical protein
MDVLDSGGVALLDASSISLDEVGTCAGSEYLEGTSLAQFLGNFDHSYDRNDDGSGGCTDNGNNSADFFLRSPSDPQNSSSPVTTCGNATATPVPPTNTPTSTNTPTRTATPTKTPTGVRVVINEVGWGGTTASSADQWIELYNAQNFPVNLDDGWYLQAPNTNFEIDLHGIIPANGYFLLVWGTAAQATATPSGSKCVVFNNRVYDQIFSGSFSQTGEVIYLMEGNVRRDTAGQSLTKWWAGEVGPPPRSMERTGPPILSSIPANSATAWFTYSGTPGTARDCDDKPVHGTPREANWATSVTITPSPIPPPTKKPTPRVPTPFAHMVINEFLPRAGTDWNHDGAVDVYDEFIELKNLGPIDVDLANWKLDDVAGAGSPMFTLPSLKLKPGERAVFYGLTTRILLEDTGDTVRLINAHGIVIDARSYGVVEHPDESHCRIPDGYYWRLVCFPTPGNENALTGVPPAPAPIVLGAPPPCLLADTVPEPFRQAECNAFGDDMWDRTYWDGEAGFGVFTIQSGHTKWKTSVE